MRAADTDAIGEAAAKLSKAAYPFMKQVNWNSEEYWMVPGGDPIKWTKAIGKIIDHGASMDMDLVKAGCEAHHLAMGKLPASGVCSEAGLITSRFEKKHRFENNRINPARQMKIA